MASARQPDILVFLCGNCVPKGSRLPRQWKQDDSHVAVREVPCSGKIDAQYLLSTLEGGWQGLCVVTCPKGKCRLAQGNYRAEIRIGTVKRLLGEVGMEPERVELLRFGPDDSPEQFEKAIGDATARISALGKSPIRANQTLTPSG